MIKFRVWSKLDNKFVKDVTFSLSGNLVEIDEKYQSNYIIQQFTGLLDKTEKEIYEGDIVNIPLYPNYIVRFGKFNISFMWLIGFYLDDGTSISNPLGFLINQTTIIGNIFENPNLLEK